MTRVLVVDDEYAVAEVLEALLTDEGYAVSIAAHGVEALERMRQERPDVCIADLMMPVMDGITFLEAIRADPALRPCPVIMMSSAAKDDAARRAGAVAFLRKPFGIDEVLEAIEHALKTKSR